MDNVTNPGGRNESVLIVTTTTFVVATIFVVARLVSRFGILKKGTLDDWVIIVAWVRYNYNCFSVCEGSVLISLSR